MADNGTAAEFTKRNETWNFIANFLDLTFYNTGLSFIFSSTVLTLYTSYLTSSAVLIGLIPAIQSVGYFLPQLLLARVTEQLPRKKPLVQKVSVMERMPYIFVGLVAIFWTTAPHWFSYIVLALSLAMATMAGGMVTPAWKAMLAKVIRVERRGLLFGGSSALGGLLGVAGAALSRMILARYPFPTSFGICFMLCFVFQVLSWCCLGLNREPTVAPTKEAVSARVYWKRLPGIFRHNPNYTRYLMARTLITLGTMGGAFYILYARRSFGITDAFAANLTIAALASQTLSTPVLGALADRLGHKWLTELGTLISLCGLVLVLLAPSSVWFYAVYVLSTAASAGMSVASSSMTMEFSDEEDLPTFTALADTIVSIPVLLAPLLGGWLVDSLGFKPMFLVAVVFLIAGWASMHWIVREPRYEASTIIVH